MNIKVEKSEIMYQSDVVNYLKCYGWEIIRMNSGRKGGITLCKAGTPDLLALKNGAALWIEMKRPGKDPTPIQKKRHKELRDNGFKVLVIHSLKELKRYSRG